MVSVMRTHVSRWALPLALFALVTLTVGVVASRTLREPYDAPFFHFPFRDVLQMKAWLATIALVLGCGQVLTAARIYDRLRWQPAGPFYQRVHRWSGRAAILITLPVAYHCIFMLGFGSETPRVLIHSLLGSTLYGAVVVKVLMVRSKGFAGWALPVAGGLLFSLLVGLWLTSALVFFSGGLSAP